MITVRKAKDRGHANFGWLDTHYTFSFNNYYDPRFMGFSDLRVINEDFIEPAKGFPTHGHKNMEILTYVVSGELSHKDSLGNGSAIFPDEVQRMSAGTGVLHSEYSSPTDKTHILQIWIMPEEDDIEPGYEQIQIPRDEKRGKLRIIASRNGGTDHVKMHQKIKIFASVLSQDQTVSYNFDENRNGWIQVVSGKISVNGTILEASDGAAISNENSLQIASAASESEFLFFDLN